MTIRHLLLPGRTSVLLAAAHLPSKLRQSAESQIIQSASFARSIRETEKRIGHERTVLVGDLNMNPFEIGLVAGAGFHAVMDRRIAARGHRRILGEDYPYFYNPMWGRMGDESPGPPGSYYYSSGEQATYFWNTFDQVLIRPSLLSRFVNKDLRVLEGDGKRSFLSKGGLPDPSVAGDHLPLLFRLRV